MVQSKNNYELMFVSVFMFRNIYYMAMRKQYLNRRIFLFICKLWYENIHVQVHIQVWQFEILTVTAVTGDDIKSACTLYKLSTTNQINHILFSNEVLDTQCV